ncbi:MAG: AHH domain-containing protein [Geminicoccaceae bacterium]
MSSRYGGAVSYGYAPDFAKSFTDPNLASQPNLNATPGIFAGSLVTGKIGAIEANSILAQNSTTLPRGATTIPGISLDDMKSFGRKALGRAGAVGLGFEAARQFYEWGNERIQRNQEAIQGAITKFGLDPKSYDDNRAARAYVAAKEMARNGSWGGPITFDPITGAANERVARGVMELEQLAPGTFRSALEVGDPKSVTMLNQVVASALAGETTVERNSTVDPALSTSSKNARKAVEDTVPPEWQRWQAHHLITFKTMRDLPISLQQKIAASGWTMDSAENLIALPADEPTYINPPNRGRLPRHSGAHDNYDNMVQGLMLTSLAPGYQKMSHAEIRAELTKIEQTMALALRNRMFHPRVN